MTDSKDAKEHGMQRVLNKLQNSFNRGDYYEAHQMYRTLYFRYLNQKKYDQLKKLLYDGAIKMLDYGQGTSGADLAELLVSVLKETKFVPNETMFDRIAILFEKMDQGLVERDAFLNNALQWSCTASTEYKTGHPDLHRRIAEIFRRQGNYTAARYHYLHSSDGCGFATMLVELHITKGYSNEIDLFIAQVVLQYLCLKKKNIAYDAFESYTSQHPNIKGPPYLLPLLNFICFLLKIIESGKFASFVVLCEKYENCIRRDPSYTDYLERISQIFFNVKPPRTNANPGFFGNLIQSLVTNLNEYESDNENDDIMFAPSSSSRS